MADSDWTITIIAVLVKLCIIGLIFCMCYYWRKKKRNANLNNAIVQNPMLPQVSQRTACVIIIAVIYLVCCRLPYAFIRDEDFHRNGYVTTTTSSAKAESERYQSSSQTLPSTMLLPQSNYIKSEHRTEVTSSYPPNPPPIGFGYSTPPIESQRTIEALRPSGETPYPPDISRNQQITHTAPYPPAARPSYPPHDLQINESAQRSNSHYGAYPPDPQIRRTAPYPPDVQKMSTRTAPYPPEIQNVQHRNETSRTIRMYPHEIREIGNYTAANNNAAPYPPDLQRSNAQYNSVSYHNSDAVPSATRTMYSNGTSSSHVPPSPPARNVSFGLTRKTQSAGELPPAYMEVVRRESPVGRSCLRKQLSETSIYDNV